MPGEIPKIQFRLPHGFSVTPELLLDEGPARGMIMGQNAPRTAHNAIFLGKLAETPYKDVWMDVRGAHVVYVMGKRRSGKSYTLGVIAEGLAASGWIRQGQFSQGVLILDTMNVYLTMPFGTSETYPDKSDDVSEIRKWKLESEPIPTTMYYPRGTSRPEGIDAEEITLRPSDLSSDEWCGLFEVDPFADPLGHLITELHGRVALDGYEDGQSGQRVEPNPSFSIDDLLAALSRDHELEQYHQDTRRALQRRLEAVRRLPVFSTAGLDVRELLRPGNISILLLRDLDQLIRSVLVALITKRAIQLRGQAEQFERLIPIHLARAEKLESEDPSRAESEREVAEEYRRLAARGLPRSWIVIDEAHNYMPSREMVPSRRPLTKYVNEGRNLGLSIIAATQQPSGLDPSIQRNADMLLIHALSHRDDIRAAEGMINANIPDEVHLDGRQSIQGTRSFETIVRNLPQGYALASTDRANRLFPVSVRPRLTVHGGFDY